VANLLRRSAAETQGCVIVLFPLVVLMRLR
jgi:hypothetical protein